MNFLDYCTKYKYENDHYINFSSIQMCAYRKENKVCKYAKSFFVITYALVLPQMS